MDNPGVTGRSLWWYLLPLALTGALLLAVLGWFSTQKITAQEHKYVKQQADIMANSLADRLAEILRTKHENLRVAANSSQIIAALRGDQATRNIAAAKIKKSLSGAIRLRLFSAYFDDVNTDIRGVAPLGYAGVDMVKRAMQGQPTAAEVHQISSGSPYIATAVPVKIGNATRGVLFAAWSLSIVKNAIRPTPRFPGKLQIVQMKSGKYKLAGDQMEETSAIHRIPVNGTTWDIVYTEPTLDWDVLGLITFVIILLSVLALATGLQFGFLRRDIQYDLHYLLHATNQNNEKSHTEHLHLRLSQQLLQQYFAKTAVESGQTIRQTGQLEEPKASRRDIPAHIFRAYDIRGLVDKEINPEIAYLLGQAFAEQAKQSGIEHVYLAYDARLSSPELARAFTEGVLEQGLNVHEIGMSPVALLYYVMHKDKQSAAVMVSGSHNPPEYNGFKLYLRAAPLMDLAPLLGRMIKADFPESSRGEHKKIDIASEYKTQIQLSFQRQLRVVVDAGNGAAGKLACELFTQLGITVIPLYCESDGRFPHHHPDPNQSKNLVDLSAKITQSKADLGVAFDGDGDRIGLVDDQGKSVRPEHVLMLLATDLLTRHASAKIVYDVKSSAHLETYIKNLGGEPILWQSGYTRIWHKMQETQALLGGEFSGHYFIQEDWHGADDAIYVAAKLIQIISHDSAPLSEQLSELPKSPASPEYQMPVKAEEAQLILQAFEKNLAFDSNINHIDGLRISFDNAWGLVRSSNTLPSLSFRFEADDEAKLNQVKRKFRELIKRVAPDKKVPF